MRIKYHGNREKNQPKSNARGANKKAEIDQHELNCRQSFGNSKARH